MIDYLERVLELVPKIRTLDQVKIRKLYYIIKIFFEE